MLGLGLKWRVRVSVSLYAALKHGKPHTVTG